LREEKFLNRDFEKVVKEIDEMLLFREIDQLIKKHEKKTLDIKNMKKSENIKPIHTINPSNQKVEIFELPTRKIIKTIKVSC
jgi:hypothetical protein